MIMMKMLPFLLPLLVLLAPPVEASRKPPTFVFDYAKPPASRWDGALELALRDKTWEDTFGTIFAYHNETLFDKLTPAMYTRITAALRNHFPEQAEELEGIAQQFAQVFPDQVVSYDYLAAWVYYHELGHADFGNDDDGYNRKSCTGLLAADASGRVHHVANMDQSPPNVREVTLHVQYIDSDRDDEQLLFQGVDWYWFNTATTRIVRKGVASFQENWRTDHVVGNIPIADMLDDIDNGVPSHVFVFRNALEKAVQDPTIGFEDLVEEMSTIRMAAPEFIVMAGPHKWQGAVIARNQTGVASPTGKALRVGETDGNPTSAQHAPEITSWALAQTNYDHWVEDNPKDPRRTVAEQTMANYGRELAASYLGLFAVASTYPVHATSTAYTAVMNVKTGELQPFVRTMICPVGDPDCLDNAEAHGLGFGVGATDNQKQPQFLRSAGGRGGAAYWIIAAMLALALLVAVGLLTKSKMDQRSQYSAVPSSTSTTNGSH